MWKDPVISKKAEVADPEVADFLASLDDGLCPRKASEKEQAAEKAAARLALSTRAIKCGFALLDLFDHTVTVAESEEGTPVDAAAHEIQQLSLHIGAGAGMATFCLIGSNEAHVEALVVGDAVQQMGLAEPAAERGQMAISGAMATVLRVGGDATDRICTLEPTSVEGVVLVQEGTDKEGERTKRDMHRQRGRATDLTHAWLKRKIKAVEGGDPMRLDRLRTALAPLLPAPARRLVAADSSASTGTTGELRNVTVLFCNFSAIPKDTQKVLTLVSPIISADNGMLRQFVVDDKGCVLIACLGVPLHMHEDDPVRGTNIAVTLWQALRDSGINVSIGVSSGSAFCGCIGTRYRREYCVAGDTVCETPSAPACCPSTPAAPAQRPQAHRTCCWRRPPPPRHLTRPLPPCCRLLHSLLALLVGLHHCVAFCLSGRSISPRGSPTSKTPKTPNTENASSATVPRTAGRRNGSSLRASSQSW